MVLVFILCTIIILTLTLLFMIVLSTVHLKIENLELSNMHKVIDGPKTPKYKVEIALYLFNKIKWSWLKLNDKKLRKMYSKMQLEKIDIRKIEKNFKIEDLKELKEIDPKVSLFHLEAKLGTEDAIFTSFIIWGISTIISIVLPRIIKEYKKDKYKYIVTPVYMNQNVYEVKLNSIIEVKMVHIINIIYIFIKKRRVDKNERTSNRRSYGYSYE